MTEFTVMLHACGLWIKYTEMSCGYNGTDCAMYVTSSVINFNEINKGTLKQEKIISWLTHIISRSGCG